MRSFEYKQTFLEKLWFVYGQRLHRLMVSKRANYFLRPVDIISHRPTLFGYHEPHIEKLINGFADRFGGFLLDIGANIGLTSCMTGKNFRRVDCVEPNDLIANILETNLAINLPDKPTAVHRVGLGEEDGGAVLKIPFENYGGAFVKDGNTHFDTARVKRLALERKSLEVIERHVEIREAYGWLQKMFRQYAKEGLERGVIKIDIEGHEEFVFKAILKVLPKNFGVVVVMENWFDRFTVTSFESRTHMLEWHYIRKRLRPLHSIPFKLLGLSNSYVSELNPLDDDTENPHDVVCVIRPVR